MELKATGLGAAREDRKSERIPLLGHQAVMVVLATIGSLMLVSASLVALPPPQQAIVAGLTMLVFIVVNRSKSKRATLFLTVLSILVSMRYIVWRLTETLTFESWLQTSLGVILVVAELYAIAMLLLGYFQTAWPLGRKPLPLPNDPVFWPTVDVFVPTYNEDLAIVRSTVLAALSLDWPPEKLNVYILDDGRRVAFRDFAAESGAGYIIRPDNFHAKAGNLNHALGQTTGEFIVIFDCDHVPTRSFLQLTMGWMVRDRQIALLQTPHHFYSPDPFQRNLAAGFRVPAEGNMFYGLVQDGNDFWDATFFCGSCAVIRRSALESIGGFATQTVTEDAHTALRLQRRGWSTAYLRLPIAGGLATERLILHIGQRIRWARGMLQIMRIDNPLLGPGLTLSQRLCYLAAMMHFLFAIPRIVFLVSPLAFLFLDQNIIAASPLAITAYAFPHIFHSVATGSRLQRNWRHSFWSEIYETVLALFLFRVTVVTLLSPRRGKFNVTDKGGVLENGYFDLRAVYPNLILALLLLCGLIRGVVGMIFFNNTLIAFQALLLNSIWVSLSLLTVLGALAVGRETRQLRRHPRIEANLALSVISADGRAFKAQSRNLSLGGAQLHVGGATGLSNGSALTICFSEDGLRTQLPAKLVRNDDRNLFLSWAPRGIADERQIIRTVLGRADTWLKWNEYPADQPWISLWTVLLSIKGLFRPRGQMLTRQQVIAIEQAEHAPTDRLRKQTLVLRPRAVVSVSALVLAVALFSNAFSASAQEVRTGIALSGPGTISARGSQVLPLPSNILALPAPATSITGPLSNASTSALTGGSTVTFSLQQFGAGGPLTMRGTSPIQGLTFGIDADSVVTAATLTLSGAMSPSLIPEASAVTVTLNEQYVGTIHVDPAHPSFGPLAFPVNPVFFLGLNKLNFRFAGQYTRTCNDPLSGLLWSTISDRSTLTLTTIPIPPRRQLSRLPLPFFDSNVRRKAVIPVVIPPEPSNETLRSAAIVASWFGRLTDFRGVKFVVTHDLPPGGNAVVLGELDHLPASIGQMQAGGPELVERANPTDPNGTLLVITGRNGAELVGAATSLALAADTLPNGSTANPGTVDLPVRAPEDAPAFISTSHPVKFGELVPASVLQGSGYVPGTMAVPFRTEPDLYTWRARPFQLDVKYRSPPGPVLDVAASRLDVGINNVYLGSYSLEPPSSPLTWMERLIRFPSGPSNRGMAIPPYMIFGQDQLQFYFDARPLNRGSCGAIPGDIRMAIDPSSSIDLSPAYHFAVLPNLASFASAGFPFTELADLSNTALVLPAHPSAVLLSAFLDLMGFFGATTWLPVTGLMVLTPDTISDASSRNLILLATLPELGQASSLLAASPYHVTGDRLTLARGGLLDGIWYLFGDRPSDRVKSKPVGLDTDLRDGAALVGAESPLSSHRSVVAFLSGTPQGLDQLAEALQDRSDLSSVQGDLVLLDGEHLTAYRSGPVYTVGSLPFWLWPDYYLRGRPIGIFVVALLGSIIVTIVLFRALLARAARRQRETGFPREFS